MRINFKRRSPRHQSTEIPTSAATHKLINTLPAFGAGLASISVIGYLISWNLLSAYYKEVDAIWYLKTLPPARILAWGVDFYVVLAMILVLVPMFFSEKTSRLRVSMIANYMLLAAAVAAFTIHFASERLPSWLLTTLELGSVLLYFICTGVIAAEIIKSLKESNLKWGATQISLLFLCYVFALQPAIRNGQAHKAKTDMDPATSKLPYIQKKDCSDCIWRIVDINEDKALVARISAIKQNRKFAIVSLDGDWEITQ